MESGSGDGSTVPKMDDYESLISTTDVEHLKRVWRREKAAPEIFQFESALIERIKEQIQLTVGPTSEISVCCPGKSRVRNGNTNLPLLWYFFNWLVHF